MTTRHIAILAIVFTNVEFDNGILPLKKRDILKVNAVLGDILRALGTVPPMFHRFLHQKPQALSIILYLQKNHPTIICC